MKRLRWTSLLLPLGLAACGPSKDAVVKADLQIAESRLNEKLAQELAQLRKEFSELQNSFERIRALSERLEVQKKELDALEAKLRGMSTVIERKVDTANTNVSKSLQIQEQYLKQQIESIRALLDELKK
jgi:DNA repair ATPase RecN